MAYSFYMRHRAVFLPENKPLNEWGTWSEAQAVLISMGMAGYLHGIFYMHPAFTIEKEGYWA